MSQRLSQQSATCYSVGTYLSLIAPFWTMSRMKWYLTSICFDLSWNTGFYVILIQIWLSQRKLVTSISSLNKLANNFWSHTASLQVEQAAMYYSFVMLSEILVYFLLNHEIMLDPKLKQQPELLFLSLALPSQYESVYPCKLISLFAIYLIP